MFAALRTLLTQWFKPPPRAAEAQATTAALASPEMREAHEENGLSEPSALLPEPAQAIPYDQNLLERARTQWQFGDWESLAQLHTDTLQHHPDRAKLALLAAAGRLQTDRFDEAKGYIRLAKEWGVSKKLLARILAAGVHNSLGRAAAIAGEQPRALQHFEAAIQTGSPGSDRRLLTQARIHEQCSQLGLSPAPLGTLGTVPPAPTFPRQANS